MKIGKLAEAAGTPIETIRFYEREGLLPAPARAESNYRTYAEQHVQRLAFIRRCRSLDMALDEIRALLKFKDAPSGDCREVNDVLDEHIGHVNERVRELRTLERQLRELRARCQSTTSGDACGILEQLSHEGPTLPPPTRRRQAVSHLGAVHGRPARTAKMISKGSSGNVLLDG